MIPRPMKPTFITRPPALAWRAQCYTPGSKLKLMAVAALLAFAAPASAQGAPGPIDQPSGQWREQTYWVPMLEPSGGQRLLFARLCRPPGEIPARVVVFAHGTPADASARVRVAPPSCDSETFRWFLTRGYAVFASVRRGY